MIWALKVTTLLLDVWWYFEFDLVFLDEYLLWFAPITEPLPLDESGLILGGGGGGGNGEPMQNQNFKKHIPFFVLSFKTIFKKK